MRDMTLDKTAQDWEKAQTPVLAKRTSTEAPYLAKLMVGHGVKEQTGLQTSVLTPCAPNPVIITELFEKFD